MKKIGLIIPEYDVGGMPRVLENISLNLDTSLYEQHLIILFKGKALNYKHKAKHVLELQQVRKKNFFIKILDYLMMIYKLWKFKRELNLDIYMSFGVLANSLNIMTNHSGKTILTEHNVKSVEHKAWGYVGRIFDYCIKAFYNSADKIIVVSQMMGHDLIRNYGVKAGKIQTIYNGIDIKRIQMDCNESIESEYINIFENPTLINVGTLAYPKGQWHLIRIMPSLLEKWPELKLVILGEGKLHGLLSNMIERLNLEDSVYLLGAKANPYKYINESKIFVLSSIYEGFPNVILEAMAVGKAIVAVDCLSGPREMLVDGINLETDIETFECKEYGILSPKFPEGILDREPLTIQEKELIKAVSELLEKSQSLKHYEEQSKLRANDFSAIKMISEYQNLLEEI